MIPIKTAVRILHLDALRAFCMLYGAINHAATIEHNEEIYKTAVHVSSNMFRMATFFLLSGYFTALAASKTSGWNYFSSRARVLLIPLMTTLITLVPITNYLIHIWHNGPMSLNHYFLKGGWREPSLGNDVWHLHLWFLFSLFTYALAAPVILRFLQRPRVAAAVNTIVLRSGSWVLWVCVLVLVSAILVMRALYTQVLQSVTVTTPFDYIVSATITYAPYFVFGMIMYTNKLVFDALHSINWSGLLFCLGLLLIANYGAGGMSVILNRVLMWAGKSGATLFIIAAMLRTFALYVNKPSKTLSFLVNSAFTFYLFHMTVIYVVANILKPFVDSNFLAFLIVTVTVPPIALFIHAIIITPSPLLRYLYNGKRTRQVNTSTPSATLAD